MQVFYFAYIEEKRSIKVTSTLCLRQYTFDETRSIFTRACHIQTYYRYIF